MIAAPRTGIPIPQAVRDLLWSTDPADRARQAGVMLVAAGVCEDPQLRIAHQHTRAAEIAAANKQLARVGHPYRWENLPGVEQKEYQR